MLKVELKNIPVEKIKIGDEEYKIKHYDMIKYKELEIQKFGLKRPFTREFDSFKL